MAPHLLSQTMMFNVPAERWQALENAVERICEDAMPFFTASCGSATSVQHELDKSIWNTVKRAYVRFARLRNSQTPAVRVPVDVLVAVFSYLRTPDLVMASHVCQIWREVALHHPSLWACLDATPFKPSAVYHLMKRSQPLPLRLDIRVEPETALDQAYAASDHMDRLEYLAISIDVGKPRRSRGEHSDSDSDSEPIYAAIPAALLKPVHFLRQLSIRDPHRLMGKIVVSALLGGNMVTPLRFLDYHGEIALYPFQPELASITHFTYAPPLLGRSQLDSMYRFLGICHSLEHFSLHIPSNYTFPILDLPQMPESIKHFEIHIKAEDADVPHFLPFYAAHHPLLVIALHAEPYSAEGCQRFLTHAFDSTCSDIVAIHLEKSCAEPGVITTACADSAGALRFFCDFPAECPPPEVCFTSLTSLSIGDTFWPLNILPALPQLTALELHVSRPPERRSGVLEQSSAWAGRYVLDCPALRSLMLVCEEYDDLCDRSIHSSLVLAFIRTRLSFRTARLGSLVLKHVLFTDGREAASAVLHGVVQDIAYNSTPWTWTGASMGCGLDKCTLPLHPGGFRAPTAPNFTDWR